jgi:hypothetical protein
MARMTNDQFRRDTPEARAFAAAFGRASELIIMESLIKYALLVGLLATGITIGGAVLLDVHPMILLAERIETIVNSR